MATRVWTGEAGDGVWKTAANWVNDTAPGSGDTAAIPPDASEDIIGSTAGNSGNYENVIDIFKVEEGADINIGTRSNSTTDPLKLDFSSETNAEVILAGIGTMYLMLKEAKKIIVKKAGTAPGTGQYATHILTESSTNDTEVFIDAESNESIGIAPFAGETAEVESITINGGDLTIGDSVTQKDGTSAFDLTINDGTVINSSALDTAEQNGGTFTHKEGTVATLKIYGGTCYYNSDGTITSCTVGAGGVLDFSQNTQGTTVTNIELYKGATVLDPYKVVTFTNGIDLHNCSLEDVTLDVGKDVKITIGATT